MWSFCQALQSEKRNENDEFKRNRENEYYLNFFNGLTLALTYLTINSMCS